MGRSQSVDLFVVSTYNYREAMASDLNRPGPGSDKHPYSFLHVKVAPDKTFSIEEVGSYHEGIQRTYKRRNTLLFVHGDGANINELVPLMSQVPDLYDVNVILFAWPAQEIKGITGIRNYHKAKENAAFVFDSFVHTLRHIQNCDSIAQGNVTLMFHSLGNLFAKQYAHYIVNNLDECVLFDNIILNAPAVVCEDHELWADVLSLKVKKGVYLNFNRNDRILKSVDTFLEHQSLLGRDVTAPYARKITYTDFSDVLKDASSYNDSHTYFIDVIPARNPGVMSYYRAVINGFDPDLGNRNIFRRDPVVTGMVHLVQ